MSININSTLYDLENKGNMLTSQDPEHRSKEARPCQVAAFGTTEVAEKADQPYILRVIPGCY
jgi:hypothetical protein